MRRGPRKLLQQRGVVPAGPGPLVQLGEARGVDTHDDDIGTHLVHEPARAQVRESVIEGMQRAERA
jgi:hypothetical protein